MNDRVSQQFLNKSVTVTVDRKLGSKHPKWGFIYSVNYGYIEGIIAEDGSELDAYILGVDKPLEVFEGICIAIVHRFNDVEDKLVVVPIGVTLSDEEIMEKVDFQEKFFKSKIIR
ncbi:MAG: inorganic pyrophosphatase [Candidatus Woesearchaeota archaeon]